MPLAHGAHSGLRRAAAYVPGRHSMQCCASIAVVAQPAGHVPHHGCRDGGTGQPECTPLRLRPEGVGINIKDTQPAIQSCISAKGPLCMQLFELSGRPRGDTSFPFFLYTNFSVSRQGTPHNTIETAKGELAIPTASSHALNTPSPQSMPPWIIPKKMLALCQP